MVATANDRDAAGLMGINTSQVTTFSYALSSLTAAFAGVLIAAAHHAEVIAHKAGEPITPLSTIMTVAKTASRATN